MRAPQPNHASAAAGEPRKAWRFLLVVGLLGSPGLGLLVTGTRNTIVLYRFLAQARVRPGQVVSLTPVRSDDDGTTYSLAVRYTPSGRPERQFAVETRDGSYVPEQVVEVLYTDAQPPEERVRGIQTTFRNPIIFTIVGMAWTGFAVLILVAALRHEPRGDA